MGESPLSAEEVRAAAEVHRELGPDYGDAVVESFLARIDQHFEARIDQQLGSKIARPTPADRSCPPEQAAGDPWRGGHRVGAGGDSAEYQVGGAG